jgi:hypothetical protein
MSYPTDTSIQFDYASLSILPTYSSVTNPTFSFHDGTSGIYNNTTNSIIVFTHSTTALTIDTNQCLYGNGTGLTNIGYNNVLGKPTYFPADYNTTVSNKPDL